MQSAQWAVSRQSWSGAHEILMWQQTISTLCSSSIFFKQTRSTLRSNNLNFSTAEADRLNHIGHPYVIRGLIKQRPENLLCGVVQKLIGKSSHLLPTSSGQYKKTYIIADSNLASELITGHSPSNESITVARRHGIVHGRISRCETLTIECRYSLFPSLQSTSCSGINLGGCPFDSRHGQDRPEERVALSESHDPQFIDLYLCENYSWLLGNVHRSVQPSKHQTPSTSSHLSRSHKPPAPPVLPVKRTRSSPPALRLKKIKKIANKSSTSSSLASSSAAMSNTSEIPPAWMKNIVDSINLRLDTLDQSMKELKQAHHDFSAVVIQNTASIAELNQRFDSEIGQLKERQELTDNSVRALQNELITQRASVNSPIANNAQTTALVDTCEVRLSGLPASTDAADFVTVEKVLTSLGLDRLKPHVISVREWLPRRPEAPQRPDQASVSTAAAQTPLVTRATVIRFSSSSTRDTFLASAPRFRELSSRKIFGTDDDTTGCIIASPILPQPTYRLWRTCLAKARELNYPRPFLRGLHIFMRKSREQQPFLVTSSNDLRRAGCGTIDLAFELFAEDVGLASEDQLRSQNSTIYPHREQHLVAVLEKSIAEPLSRAEVVRDVRRYSRTICPVKKCRLHANSLKEEIVPTRFRAREYETAVRDLLGTFCNVNRLVDYVNYPLEPSEYWWQLEEQLSQELDGIDTIFGNLMAPLSSCGIVGTVDVHQPSFGYNLALYLVVLTVNTRLILNLFYQDDNGANRFPKITSMPSSSWLSCSSSCHQYSDGSSG
ncbi:unnamed protein product [Trichogramma brassicae]|uniref:Uncharacterized protein n=1 Tax=Trichogramma brassicae TaxID=86971 RepID=A0A6H5IEK1_9HYME|nr:unnamed protein product [Trichogramma brassicae]